MISLRMSACNLTKRRRWLGTVACPFVLGIIVVHFLYELGIFQSNDVLFVPSCASWKTSDAIMKEASRRQPKIPLNSDKLLLPVLYNGPSNQLWGLRQAAYLAILLNRTLALPIFHKHITDDSGPGGIIDANHRLQLESLTGFISVISSDEFLRRCGGKINAVFLAAPYRSWMTDVLKKTEEELNITVLRHTSTGETSGKQRYSVPAIPTNVQHFKGDEIQLIRSSYKTEANCALYTFPFREIRMVMNRTATLADYEQYQDMLLGPNEQVSAWPLLHGLFFNTQTPEYIKEVALAFMKWAFGNRSYLALHWRYDKSDFYKFMCQNEKGKGNPHQAQMCRHVSRVKPEALGRAISEHIALANKHPRLKIEFVYIAAPRMSILPFLLQLENTLREHNLHVLTQNDFQFFIRNVEYFSHCPLIEENRNDFTALAEMEICAQSSVFLRSTYSSWSDSVILNRVLLHKDRMRIFDQPAIELFNAWTKGKEQKGFEGV